MMGGLLTGLLVVGCADDSDGGSGSNDTDAPAGETEPTGGGPGTGGPDDSTSGADESGGGEGGGSGVDTADLDRVEDACEADCEAQFSTECAPTNTNVLVCKLNCAVATVNLDNFCLDEYVATVQCRADGGYDCVNEFPTPRSTCAAEQQTYGECTADLGCKRRCVDGIEEGCISDDFDTCASGCIADKEMLPDFCGIYLDQFALCQAQLGTVCSPGNSTEQDLCTRSLADAGDCIVDDGGDLCAGFCFVAEQLECPSNCMADCESRVADMTCGESFERLAECQLRHGDFVCTDGRLAGIDICDGEEADYQACLAG